MYFVISGNSLWKCVMYLLLIKFRFYVFSKRACLEFNPLLVLILHYCWFNQMLMEPVNSPDTTHQNHTFLSIFDQQMLVIKPRGCHSDPKVKQRQILWIVMNVGLEIIWNKKRPLPIYIPEFTWSYWWKPLRFRDSQSRSGLPEHDAEMLTIGLRISMHRTDT